MLKLIKFTKSKQMRIFNTNVLLENCLYRNSTRYCQSQNISGLKQKVALITGSTSGIGLGIAKGLAQQGCQLILNGFGDVEEITQLTNALQNEYKVPVNHISSDLSKKDDLKSMCSQIKNIHPSGVDILVNNAGFQFVSKVEDFSNDVWDKMLAVMLTAPFHLIKHCVPDMKNKGWGRIINISSVHGLKASPNKSAYVTCKHGILGLTKVVALETAGSGITCNAICPGYVDTPILQIQVKALAEKENINYDEAKVKFLSNFHATGQPVGIEQISAAVAFICSEAATQVTGSSAVLDGGWSAK